MMRNRRKWIAFWAALLLLLGGCHNPAEEEPRQTTGPASSAEGELICEEISRFTGAFVEDGKDQPVKDVAAILVANNTGKFLDLATVTYRVGDRTATFRVMGLPAGRKAWVMESNRLTLTDGDELVLDKCTESYHPAPVLTSDALSVARQGQALTLTNTSDRKLTNVAVYYKNTLEDGTFLGGISYVTVFGDMEPGETKTLSKDHFGDTSEIVRFSYQ